MPGFRLRIGSDGPVLEAGSESNEDADAIYGSILFEEAQAAAARNMDDETWYECSRAARAQMVAYERAKRMIERIFAERITRNIG